MTILITTFVCLLGGRIFLNALLLWVGLRWAKVAHIPVRRLIVASAVVLLLEIILGALFSLPSVSTTGQAILWGLAAIATSIAVSCSIISKFFSTGAFRSLQAWLPMVLSPIVGLLVASLIVRPYLFESFVTPTNAMAPTLLGVHWRSTCPDCGQPNYCSPVKLLSNSQPTTRMICENFHVRQISPSEQTTYPSDHFLVTKFIAPRRWDLVAFHYPAQPEILYVKRLVGLPGETIHIEDGAVWADGVRLEVPEDLKGIEYLSTIPDFPQVLWGAPERPAKLQDGEYFVLGDFSANSGDSRIWDQGAPGHNPFAVPGSYIRGVVTHVFWPLDRLRTLR